MSSSPRGACVCADSFHWVLRYLSVWYAQGGNQDLSMLTTNTVIGNSSSTSATNPALRLSNIRRAGLRLAVQERCKFCCRSLSLSRFALELLKPRTCLTNGSPVRHILNRSRQLITRRLDGVVGTAAAAAKRGSRSERAGQLLRSRCDRTDRPRRAGGRKLP